MLSSVENDLSIFEFWEIEGESRPAFLALAIRRSTDRAAPFPTRNSMHLRPLDPASRAGETAAQTRRRW
jgi:hypothetical protein